VLDFNRKNHDFGLQDSKIANTKTFEPRTKTWSSWSPDELKKAREIISGTMAALGYRD
jgi:hypothetical protein